VKIPLLKKKGVSGKTGAKTINIRKEIYR